MKPRDLLPSLVLAALLLPMPALAQTTVAPAPAPLSEEQAIIQMQLNSTPTTPPPGMSGAEAGAIYQHYIAGIGKDRSPFSDSTSSTSGAGYSGASSVSQ